MPGIELNDFVCTAAREYLASILHCDTGIFTIESAVRGGSPNLRRVIAQGRTRPRANDTSFGAGFAPCSKLEGTVKRTAYLLHSPGFRAAFPAAGDDYKVMDARIRKELRLTIALALVDRQVCNVGE